MGPTQPSKSRPQGRAGKRRASDKALPRPNCAIRTDLPPRSRPVRSQMLKRRKTDLDFAEKCSNFVVQTEQAGHIPRLLRCFIALVGEKLPGTW